MTDNTTTEEVRKKIAEYVRTHPELTLSSIAGKLGIGCSTLNKLLADAEYHRRSYKKLASVDLTRLEE
jgi:DNA-binding transcriptional regulator LsrR (DeoR family)